MRNPNNGRHVAIALTDTDVGVSNQLIAAIEESLRGTGINRITVLDYGLENLFADIDTSMERMKFIKNYDIGASEPRSVRRVSRVGINPEDGEVTRLFMPSMDGQQRLDNALANIDAHGITDLVIIGGVDGLTKAEELRSALCARGFNIRFYGVPLNMDGNIGYKKTDGTQTTLIRAHSLGHPSACADIINQTLEYDTFAYNTTRAVFLTTLGGGAGYVAAAGTAGGAMMMIIPEMGDMDSVNYNNFCKGVVYYLKTNKSLVVTVAEKSSMPIDGDTPTREIPFETKPINVPLYYWIRNKKSGHGITEGNYMAHMLNEYFKRSAAEFSATDQDVGYDSRCAPASDFDKKLARVMGEFLSMNLISASSSNLGGAVVVIPVGNSYSDLEKNVQVVSLDHIVDVPFPIGNGGFLNDTGFSTTQDYRDMVARWCKIHP